MGKVTTDEERDRLAEEWLVKRRSRDWYIGEATTAEWKMAYKHVDAALAKGKQP